MDNKKILRKEKQKRKRKKQENKDFMAGLLRDSFGEFEKDENICAYCYQSIVNYYESTFDGVTTMTFVPNMLHQGVEFREKGSNTIGGKSKEFGLVVLEGECTCLEQWSVRT